MSINQVQFQKGLSLAEFFERYGSEEQCHAALVGLRWPDGFVCPDCGCAQHCTFVREERAYWQCRECRHQTTVMAGTIFAATKLPLTVWFLAMHLLTQAKNNVSALELKRHLGVCYRTAWLVKHKLLQVMVEREAARVLAGVSRSMTPTWAGSSPGQDRPGFREQGVVRAAVQTNDARHPLPVCLKKLEFTKDAIAAWASTPLAASTRVVSDGLWCFQAVTASGATHQRIVTGGGRASVRMAQFRAVNTFLGNLKTAYSGTYHAFDFAKYAHRYLAEVQYRFNRRFDLSAILRRLLAAAVGTAPRPERLPQGG